MLQAPHRTCLHCGASVESLDLVRAVQHVEHVLDAKGPRGWSAVDRRAALVIVRVLRAISTRRVKGAA